jgi:hypothetical protein
MGQQLRLSRNPVLKGCPRKGVAAPGVRTVLDTCQSP